MRMMVISKNVNFDYQIVLVIIGDNEISVQLGVDLEDNLRSMSSIAACCLGELCVLGFSIDF